MKLTESNTKLKEKNEVNSKKIKKFNESSS
jgi:hypothetical protein